MFIWNSLKKQNFVAVIERIFVCIISKVCSNVNRQRCRSLLDGITMPQGTGRSTDDRDQMWCHISLLSSVVTCTLEIYAGLMSNFNIRVPLNSSIDLEITILIRGVHCFGLQIDEGKYTFSLYLCYLCSPTMGGTVTFRPIWNTFQGTARSRNPTIWASHTPVSPLLFTRPPGLSPSANRAFDSRLKMNHCQPQGSRPPRGLLQK